MVILAFVAAVVGISGAAILVAAPVLVPVAGVLLRVLVGTERRLQQQFLGTDFPEPVYAADFPSALARQPWEV